MGDTQPTAPPRQRLAPGNVRIIFRSALRAMRRTVFRRRGRGGVTVTGAADRNAELVAIGMRMGRKAATRQARRAFASAARKDELDRRHMVRTAEDVVRVLGGMKGLLMKLGQMQSYLNESLPPEWKDALAKLQDDAPPMAPELAASVIVDDLGAAPDQLFAEWDPVPIAAASVGQVHRAMTRDGRAVAVKVQYPGAAGALTADLDNMDQFIALQAAGGVELPFDIAPLMAEVRARVTEEADYRREADNQRRFAAYFAGHPRIRVPAVVDELSSDHVLTTELFDGVRFAEVEGWDQHERDLAGETIFRFVFHSVFRMGGYNGDPHPGNYLFRPGGEVCFLDFGLCRLVEPEVTAVLAALQRSAVVEPDPQQFRKEMEAAGFLHPNAPVSTDLVFQTVAVPWQGLLSHDETQMPFPDTELRPPVSAEEKALAASFNLPPTFLLLTTRTLVGMQALLARLGSRRAWRGIAEEIWPFSDVEPSTELGRLEQDWVSTHGRRSPMETG